MDVYYHYHFHIIIIIIIVIVIAVIVIVIIIIIIIIIIIVIIILIIIIVIVIFYDMLCVLYFYDVCIVCIRNGKNFDIQWYGNGLLIAIIFHLRRASDLFYA